VIAVTKKKRTGFKVLEEAQKSQSFNKKKTLSLFIGLKKITVFLLLFSLLWRFVFEFDAFISLFFFFFFFFLHYKVAFLLNLGRDGFVCNTRTILQNKKYHYKSIQKINDIGFVHER
jgi:hypothetical protein